MKKCFIAIFIFVVLAGGTFRIGHAEDRAVTVPQIEMLDDAVIEKLVTSSEPSEQHQLLAPLLGDWYYELRYWMKEGAEPQISTGIATNELILGERYLFSKKSLILNIGGQNIPYENWEMIGYDKNKKIFTFIKADSMHDGVIIGNGLYNEKWNVIEEKGTFKNPLDAKEHSYRSALHFAENGTFKRTFFIVGKSGKEFQIIEITYQKR